jgi:hypothetical protein
VGELVLAPGADRRDGDGARTVIQRSQRSPRKRAGRKRVNIDHIVAAVGCKPDSRKRLLSNLEGVVSLYRTGVSLRGRAGSQRRQSGEKIIKLLNEASELISDKTWIRLWSHRPALYHLIGAIEEEMRAQVPDELTNMLGVGHDSAFEALVRHLRITFKQRFGKKAGRSRDPKSGKIKPGPFVRFVKAFQHELGQRPYSDETIAKAIAKAAGKSGGNRRKKNPKSPI